MSKICASLFFKFLHFSGKSQILHTFSMTLSQALARWKCTKLRKYFFGNQNFKKCTPTLS